MKLDLGSRIQLVNPPSMLPCVDATVVATVMMEGVVGVTSAETTPISEDMSSSVITAAMISAAMINVGISHVEMEGAMMVALKDSVSNMAVIDPASYVNFVARMGTLQ
jgi:hypothetical protein